MRIRIPPNYISLWALLVFVLMCLFPPWIDRTGAGFLGWRWLSGPTEEHCAKPYGGDGPLDCLALRIGSSTTVIDWPRFVLQSLALASLFAAGAVLTRPRYHLLTQLHGRQITVIVLGAVTVALVFLFPPWSQTTPRNWAWIGGPTHATCVSVETPGVRWRREQREKRQREAYELQMSTGMRVSVEDPPDWQRMDSLELLRQPQTCFRFATNADLTTIDSSRLLIRLLLTVTVSGTILIALGRRARS